MVFIAAATEVSKKTIIVEMNLIKLDLEYFQSKSKLIANPFFVSINYSTLLKCQP